MYRQLREILKIEEEAESKRLARVKRAEAIEMIPDQDKNTKGERHVLGD